MSENTVFASVCLYLLVHPTPEWQFRATSRCAGRPSCFTPIFLSMPFSPSQFCPAHFQSSAKKSPLLFKLLSRYILMYEHLPYTSCLPLALSIPCCVWFTHFSKLAYLMSDLSPIHSSHIHRTCPTE